MPSDTRVLVALKALQRPIAEFRATVDGALAQAVEFLATLESDPAARLGRVRGELGPFGDDRLSAEGFAALFARPAGSPLSHQDRYRSAVETLRDVLARGDGLFVAQVPSGGSLTRSVEDALSRIGRAFGAVLAMELVRAGTYRPEARPAAAAVRVPFVESRRAPVCAPLVVQVSGSDLHVGGLADYCDGRERLVLVVHGDCRRRHSSGW